MSFKTFHKGKYYITFKRGFEDCKKDVTVTIDKLFETDTLRISLSDDEEPTFFCVLTITRLDYEDLKKQQGLLVDFDNFPSQLVRLLQQCASNNIAYCQSFYSCTLWVKYTQKAYNPLHIQYNNALRMLLGLPRFCSASGMFAEARLDDFYAIMSKRCASMLRRFRGGPNSILATLADKIDGPFIRHWAGIHVRRDMFLIMQQKNPALYYLEVVEHNEFKRLVHLSLKTGPATDADIKQHMSDTIINLKKNLSSFKSSAMNCEAVLNEKCMNMERKINDLTHTLTRMEEDKLKYEMEFRESLKQEKEKNMQEKMLWQQNAELNMKTQLTTYQDNLSKKEKQTDELNSHCKQLRENIGQLENQLSEKSQCLNMLEKEVQKSHIEVATLKAKNASLEMDIMEKEKQHHQLNSKCVYLEKTVKDNSDVIKELNSSLQLVKKEKLSLEERLALSESLVNRNNDALHSTSEQLLKANQIISKQNADLIEMKEKLLCRTAIALEQEKVIERNTKEMEELKERISNTNQCMDKVQKELNDLKEKYETNEKALKDRDETIKNNNMVIQWLHKKLDNVEPTDLQSRQRHVIQTATSSTPYFLPRNNHHTEYSHGGMSEESIDFYATSKSASNLEESPGPQIDERGTKVGLDPKYLQPSETGNQIGKGTKTKSSNPPSQTGKENMNINLPKVNYREKKSARGSTYRTTPVSAYFP